MILTTEQVMERYSIARSTTMEIFALKEVLLLKSAQEEVIGGLTKRSLKIFY